jgi:hypothetical protein
VNYRPWLEEQVLRQMASLPAEAFDALSQTLARICADPHDRLFSRPVRAGDPAERMAELGDSGFIEFTVDEAEGLVHVYTLVWSG